MHTLLLAILLSQIAALSQPAAEPEKPCAILKRMGPADQVTSHLYSFGIRGKQFQFVEGQLPKGIKFHGRLTDHDVRKIQDGGGRVTIIDSHYTEQELELARKSCASATQPATPGSAASQAQATPSAPATAQRASQPSSSTEPSTVVLKSTPDGADVTVDGKYVGSTPSTLKLAPGDHTVSIEKSGFKAWQRTVTVSPGGAVAMDATLEKIP